MLIALHNIESVPQFVLLCITHISVNNFIIIACQYNGQMARTVVEIEHGPVTLHIHLDSNHIIFHMGQNIFFLTQALVEGNQVHR